jgi:hypothetical protein
VLCVGVLAGVDAAVELLLELLLEPQPASSAAATVAVAARVRGRVISPPDCLGRFACVDPPDANAARTFPAGAGRSSPAARARPRTGPIELEAANRV